LNFCEYDMIRYDTYGSRFIYFYWIGRKIVKDEERNCDKCRGNTTAFFYRD
jgi:hypothetical protein